MAADLTATAPRRLAAAWLTEYAPPVGLAIGVAGIAAAEGGYFPTAWGWSALAFCWAAALALLLRTSPRIGRAEALFLGLTAAFTGWIALSIAWSSNVSGSVVEVERALVYASGFLAFLLVARNGSVERLLGALLGAAACICTYALATRLFPDSLADTDFTGYRLSDPVGYWNALGLLAALAILLAAGFATRARSTAGRCLAAATLPVLFPTLLYTYGRGAWVALAAGLVVAVALAERRLQLISGMLALTPACVLAVWLASQPDALTRRGATLDAATDAGHRVALEVALLVAASIGSALAFAAAERRIHPGAAARRWYAIGLVAAAVVVLVAGLVALGHPVRRVENAYHGFVTDTSGGGSASLNQRLLQFSSSGRRDHWRVAIKEFGQHPVAGSGAGTFEENWYRYRSIPNNVRDAHSLYVETLGELGIVGLVLLVAMLAIPFAGVRARSRPLVPLALGAYAAFLVHAGYDWDWELPAITLAGVFCGLAALVAARREERMIDLGPRARGGLFVAIACVAGFALVGLVGNMAVASSNRALAAEKWDRAAAQAHRAADWAPWAARPWYLLAQAERARGRPAAGLAALREALERDPGNRLYWRDLALLSKGRERAEALARARALDPAFNTLPTR